MSLHRCLWSSLLMGTVVLSPQISLAESAHEQALEHRLTVLEQELADLKTKLNDRPPTSRRSEYSNMGHATVRSNHSVGRVVPTGDPTSDHPADRVEPARNEPAPTTNNPNDGDKPQALQTFRDNAVTVKAHQIEVETDLGYQRNATSLQSDRLIIGGTSIRYGIQDWLELSGELPYGSSFRVTSLGAAQVRRENLIGVGDASIQANAQLVQQTENIPGIVGTLGVDLPTGVNPYDFSTYRLDQPGFARTPNPSNIFGDYISRGVWGARANLQMYKTVDPVIFFWGGGIDYPFSTTISGYSVHPGTVYNYNFGASLALSEKTTLGFTVLGSYQDFITVNNRVVAFSSSEPILARLSLIERFADAWYLEPSIAFGITSDAPSIYGDLGVRYRF